MKQRLVTAMAISTVFELNGSRSADDRHPSTIVPVSSARRRAAGSIDAESAAALGLSPPPYCFQGAADILKTPTRPGELPHRPPIQPVLLSHSIHCRQSRPRKLWTLPPSMVSPNASKIVPSFSPTQRASKVPGASERSRRKGTPVGM